MKKKLLVLSILITGLSFANGAWAGNLFDVPVTGGIPQCMVDLDTCETGLNICTEDLLETSAELSTCTNSLGMCTTNLGVCNSDLGICSADLGSCTSELGTCTSELETCGTDLITCSSNLTQTSDLLNICEVDLLSCQESEVVFPATGQTTCWTQAGVMIDCDVEAGEDGYFQAGGALGFIWNNDGTLVDVNTKLMWARQDKSGGIHDSGNRYRWVQTFREYIYALNNTCKSDETVDCSAGGNADCESALGAGEVCGFAGYRDWRVPNVKEMLSIVDYSQSSLHLAFNWLCGEGCSMMGETGCSCSGGPRFWTSTTVIDAPDRAWYVRSIGEVHDGIDVSGDFEDYWKYSELNVRAVRGGTL